MKSFKLNKENKCLIATPVNHLPLVEEFINKRKEIFIVEEKINKSHLEKKLIQDKNIKYLFVNPNTQGYLIDEELLSKVNIKGINTCSTGLNHIDTKYCDLKKILVTSLKEDFDLINNLPSTSELAFALLQGLFRKIILCNDQVVENGIWDYRNVMGFQLEGKTIGCLGYGRLGKIFCRQLKGFNVEIKVCEKEPTIIIPENYEKVSIEKLFSICDAVAIHIHSTKFNKKLIGSALLSKTKKGFCLVNTSRGDICDESEISKYIIKNHLGGYATDVLATEFTNINESPIYKLAKKKIHNIIITPHVGGMTFEGQTKAFLYALNKFDF